MICSCMLPRARGTQPSAALRFLLWLARFWGRLAVIDTWMCFDDLPMLASLPQFGKMSVCWSFGYQVQLGVYTEMWPLLHFRRSVAK